MKTEEQYNKEYAEAWLSYRAKPNPSLLQKMRNLKICIRRVRKPKLMAQCTRQAYAAKALMIRDGKGRNGKSMSPALLDLHLQHS